MELCSGGIVGMGEQPADVRNGAGAWTGVHSIPINFLNPIEGTPLAGLEELVLAIA